MPIKPQTKSESQFRAGKGRVGLRGPFGMSPARLAMMSRLPEAEVREIIAANLSRCHRSEGFDESGFRRAVADAMKNGYATYDNIVPDRTTSGLGVPICDASGYPRPPSAPPISPAGWAKISGRSACMRLGWRRRRSPAGCNGDAIQA